MHLLDGCGDGGALLLRIHHAIADGGALVQVLLSLADPLDAGEHQGVLPVHDDAAEPRKAAELAGLARADVAMLRKLGFGLTAGRNLLQGPLVPGKQRAWTRPVPVEAVKDAGAATGSRDRAVFLCAQTCG